MPIRPLSHSSISTYLDCPQKYRFRYVDKIPDKPKGFFSFGKSVHDALEFFYRNSALPSLEELLSYYETNWISKGYKDSQQEIDYKINGKRILTEFFNKHVSEIRQPLFLEYQFNLRVQGVPVIGYIDRIDRLDDGSIAIVDYKTGKEFAPGRVQSDPQLTMYQMACEELLGLKVSSVGLYHLESLTLHSSKAHSVDQVSRLRDQIVTVASDIDNQIFDPKPEERKCRWCDYKSMCPAFVDVPSTIKLKI